MPLNSTAEIGESNSSKTQLILNTTQFSGQDLSDYLSLCEEVERIRLSQRQRSSQKKSMKATMTREEIFECSTINDDEFLSALEHQSSYIMPPTANKLNLSQSIEDMLQYFDEDVSVSSKSNRSTPTNLNAMGKVAAMVATFAKKYEKTSSDLVIKEMEKNDSQQRSSVKELKAKYESPSPSRPKPSVESESKSTNVYRIQTPPVLKTPSLIAAAKPATTKPSPKSKVKQIAQMFNAKISQLVHRNSSEVGQYAPLNNEYSPEVKPQSLSSKVSNSAFPVPKPRKKLTDKRSGAQSPRPPSFCIRSPKPSPRLKRRPSFKVNSGKSLMAEDAFSQLSVRDKVLLYTKFIEDMSQKNPKFSKHAEILESNARKQFACGEVINERQESVKHLKEELEAKCAFPKHTISPKALIHMQSANDVTFIGKSSSEGQNSMKDGNGLFHAECVQIEEDEDDHDDYDKDSLHVSTLTVVLKPSPRSKLNKSSPTGRPKHMTRSKRNQRLLDHLSLTEPSQKRSSESIRSNYLSSELYAPPKKIRRTRSERLSPQQFFQNTDLETLFFSWMKERSGVDFNIAHSDNEQKFVKIVQTEEDKSIASVSDVTQKSAVERLLEEAIAKLENTTIANNNSREVEIIEEECEDGKVAPENPPSTNPTEIKRKVKRKPKAPAPPVPAQSSSCSTTDSSAKQSDIDELEADSSSKNDIQSTVVPPVPAPRRIVSNPSGSVITSDKQSDIDSESGVSTLPKVHSDESQPEQEQYAATSNTTSEFEFVKPQKPPRKKKMRRSISSKNEIAIVESNSTDIVATATTDSDSDYKVKTLQTLPSPPNFKQRGNHIKKLCFRTLKAITTPKKVKNVKSKQEQTPVGLNKKFLRIMNSPRRIKSAYTLTVLSSPSPNTESEPGDFQPNRETSRSWPSMLTVGDQNTEGVDRPASVDITLQKEKREQRPLSDSYVDQGFETATNSIDSPVRRTKLTGEQPISPLFFCLRNELNNTSSVSFRRSSYGLRLLYNENPSNYSTPVKGHHVQKSFISPAIAQQQEFSPIQTPFKSSLRRRSIYDNDSRRSSIAMQVIQEDHPYDPKDPIPNSPDSVNTNESAFFANAPTLDMPSNFEFSLDKPPHSTFWIIVDDYTVAIKIFYNSTDRLRLLYDIFSQKNVDYKKIHFGIDDHKFTPYDPKDNFESISTHLPPAKDSSHYWFSTGDLAVPFNGKYMPSKKVRRLFNFINSCFEPNSVLRFGVDNFEFTHPRERFSTTTKLSMESSYSMLVGLQSGNSNGLEGRSRFAWPNPMCHILNANNAKTSDLDQSDLDSSSFCSTDLRYQSYSLSNSPISSHNSTPRHSEEPSSPDIYEHIYENDSLAQIYKDAQQYNLSKSQTDKMPQRKSMTVPELLEILQNQQLKLKSVEERISAYTNRASISNAVFEQFKESPEYVRKLRNIIKVIDNIGRDNGFKACSLQQLESFMVFLSSYADICLAKCSDHMNQILDTLMEQRSVEPPENELQKSHEQNPAALSEHQLRIQASLQRLNIPDWFRQYNQAQTSETGGGTGTGSTYKPGNFTRKRTQESGRWAGLNSKTTSLSSLGSQRSDRSPLLLSPSAHSHHGGQTTVAGHQQPHVTTSAYSTAGTGSSGGTFSRWSTSHLNSSQTSPSVSQRGSFSRGGPINSSFMSVASSGNSNSTIRNSFRQPYLGWRSTEKLSQRTAHERLASSMLAQQQRTSPTQRTSPAANGSITGFNSKLQQPVTPEIQSSIKEVTSAIVHYVNDQTNQQRSRSTSPNSRKCWLESSFVGIRPLDSPQTPVIETGGTAFSVAAAAAANNLTNNSNNFICNNPIQTETTTYLHNTTGTGTAGTASSSIGLTTNAANVLRMNGLSLSGGAPERSLSSASLEDVLASLLGLPSTSDASAGLSTSDPYARSTTGDTVKQNPMVNYRHMPQQQQLQVNNQIDQRLRRRSEGDTPNSQKTQQQPSQQQAEQQQQQKQQDQENAYKFNTASGSAATNNATSGTANVLQPRRVSLGDSSESCHNNKTNTSSELQIRCRNTKCEHSAAPADAKKYYKSCHNCSHLYCSRECRRAHWEKHRKACLHSRASNLCRQVLSTCKDDVDSQRHLSLLARKGYLSQGRGVVRILFRSAEAAEGFIKHGFQCMGEASYVRWPDLMPAEMGLELYAELLKLSTEYKPDSKMLIYVAICVVSEAPGMGQAPVRWERQLVSRCAKLKLCKSTLIELEQQQQALQQQPLAVVAIPEPTTEVLILTFNPNLRSSIAHRELILSNILDILSRRGVFLRKHYPEIYQRLQSYTEGQTEKFNPVTLHPRDSQTGQSFVCIIMPVHSESEIIKLPSAADGGNRVTTIDVGSPAALAELDDDELLTRSTS